MAFRQYAASYTKTCPIITRLLSRAITHSGAVTTESNLRLTLPQAGLVWGRGLPRPGRGETRKFQALLGMWGQPHTPTSI
jgi:hypothetical protein